MRIPDRLSAQIFKETCQSRCNRGKHGAEAAVRYGFFFSDDVDPFPVGKGYVFPLYRIFFNHTELVGGDLFNRADIVFLFDSQFLLRRCGLLG